MRFLSNEPKRVKDDKKEYKQCVACKLRLLLEMFKFTRQKYTKACIKCLEYDKKRKKNSRCKHGKEKSRCKECGGSGLCEHGKQKSRCKECDGICICEHGTYRSTCKKCGGGSICEHGNRRSICRECGGGSICEHGKIRSQCNECGGGSMCEHGKRRYQCKECCGTGICDHGNRKSICKECRGSQICEHNRIRSECKKCGGGSICEHDKRRTYCIICTPKRACHYCKYVLVKSNYRFHPYCFQCYCVLNPDEDIPRKFMIKENYLRKELKNYFFDDELVFNKIIDDGCSLRRPDVRIELLTHSIIIENDEEQHKNTSCENKRTMELFAALGNRPLVMIRFNPDKYTKKGVKVKGCFKDNKTSLSIDKEEWNKRINELISEIHYHMDNIPEKEVTTEYMYYDS